MKTDRLLDARVTGTSACMAEQVKAAYYDEEDAISTIFPGMLRYFDIPDVMGWTNRSV